MEDAFDAPPKEDERILLEEKASPKSPPKVSSSGRTLKRTVCILLFGGAAFLLILVLAVTVVLLVVRSNMTGSTATLPTDPLQRAKALLSQSPLIDGHNDLAYAIRSLVENQLDKIDLSKHVNRTMTDIPRLREGLVGAQFWSAYMGCSTQFKDATRTFIDQMDVITRFVAQYSDTFQFAKSSNDIKSIFEDKKIASLIGVEGGHAIDSSLATLRQLYSLGARYMTLTHVCNTPWADSCSVPPEHGGLTEFGVRVVHEMNRLGMLVDISHVSADTMRATLNVTKAPVMFSHSSAYTLCNNSRNVPDDVLKRLPENGGVVMVNFYPQFINCSNTADLSQVADHIDYIRKVAGIDHVGIGSDFDGISQVPTGLEDVSKYPYLFAELIRRGYSDDDIKKVAGLNLIRVFEGVEQVRDSLKRQNVMPDNTIISPQPNETCRPDF